MTLPVLNLELLRAFEAVAEHGSFTRAAEGLHRTQSAVSLQIKRLEASLGTTLFDRGAQRVEMTAAGHRLLGYAKSLAALGRQAVEDVGGRQPTRTVRLGVMEDYGIRFASRLVAEFADAHPGSSIELHTGLTTPMLDRLGRDFDLVIAMHPAGAGRGHLLRRERPVWAVGRRFRAQPGDAIPLALYAPGCLLREWAIAALDGANRRWALAFAGENIASVHAAASNGRALTVVKSGMFPRGLRRAPPAMALPRLPTADVRLHRAAGLPAIARALADHFVNSVPSVPIAGAAAGAAPFFSQR